MKLEKTKNVVKWLMPILWGILVPTVIQSLGKEKFFSCWQYWILLFFGCLWSSLMEVLYAK
jgi:hypothetical protein